MISYLHCNVWKKKNVIQQVGKNLFSMGVLPMWLFKGVEDESGNDEVCKRVQKIFPRIQFHSEGIGNALILGLFSYLLHIRYRRPLRHIEGRVFIKP